MPQSLACLLVHIVFSTKNRVGMITPGVEGELFAYMSGVLRNHASPCLAINGTANHVHLLILQAKTEALSTLIRDVKRSSSKWIKTKGPEFRRFDWQEGYGAFTIGQSGVAALKEYIANQKEKHKTRSFETEFLYLLKKYGVDYNEKCLWG